MQTPRTRLWGAGAIEVRSSRAPGMMFASLWKKYLATFRNDTKRSRPYLGGGRIAGGFPACWSAGRHKDREGSIPIECL
jgi:hypothetical protein